MTWSSYLLLFFALWLANHLRRWHRRRRCEHRAGFYTRRGWRDMYCMSCHGAFPKQPAMVFWSRWRT